MAGYLERRARRLQKEKADREKTVGEREQKLGEQNPGGQKSVIRLRRKAPVFRQGIQAVITIKAADWAVT